MKNLVKILGLIGLITVFLASCSKEELPIDQNGDVNTTNKGPVGPQTGIDPVAFGPDLIVSAIYSDLPELVNSACGGPSAQTFCGQQYTLTVEVTNIGNAPVTDFYEILVAKTTGNQFTLPRTSPTMTLAPGATHVFNIGPAPFGGCSGNLSTQTILAFADYTDVIDETREDNNRSRPYTYCGD